MSPEEVAMREIEVLKARLVETLAANKATHEADFDLAWEGFIDKVLTRIDGMRADTIAARKTPGISYKLGVGLNPPVSYSEDYRRALEMCEWEVADTVNLTEDEFKQFVQDEWDWKRQFVSSANLYTGHSSPSTHA
jgi:hypothetical protein